MNETNVTKSNELSVVKNDYLQMMPHEQATEWYAGFKKFVGSILKEGLDYGTVQGTNSKPSLLKPGAEKLRFVYSMTTEMDQTEKIVDLQNKFLSFTYKCTAKSPSGQILAQCEGNCNSAETKYAYLWKAASDIPAGMDVSKFESKPGKKIFEFDFAINKAETTGQYGKPAEYWAKFREAIQNKTAKKVGRKTRRGEEMFGYELSESNTLYRVPNPDVVGLQNTIMKMSQKRAFVGAVLMATGASEFFTQDIEDMTETGISDPYNEGNDFQDAEILHEDHAPKTIPDVWLKKGANCKEPADIEQIFAKNVETLNANPHIAEFLHNRRLELWKEKLDKCTSPDDVDALGKKYSEDVNKFPDVRKLFVYRKSALKPVPDPATQTTSYNHDAIVSEGKPLLMNEQFKEALEKIQAGEIDVYYKITAEFSLENTQSQMLQSAYTEARDKKNKAKKDEADK